MTNALEIRGLKKNFGDFSLDIPQLDLPAGTIMGLIGENGAGKSTTLRLIMNAIARDAGSVNVLGCDNGSAEFRSIKEKVGVVLDEAYFPEVLNARQVNVIMKNTYSNWDAAKYTGLVKKFELPETKLFKDYSRGMRMKLAIAVALSHDAQLLLLDEATGGLDPIVRDEILDIFIDFTRDEAHSVLISSHIVSDLEKICDSIAFLHKGGLAFCEDRDSLMEKYALLRCTHSEYDSVDKSAVVGVRDNKYGMEALVLRNRMPAGVKLETAGIEDIMLYMVKGEQKQ